MEDHLRVAELRIKNLQSIAVEVYYRIASCSMKTMGLRLELENEKKNCAGRY